MAEYLSPGVYIEELPMGTKPIEGVSTSTVGFVGVSGLIEILPKANTIPSNAALKDSLKALRDKLTEANGFETNNKNVDMIKAVGEISSLVDVVEETVENITNETEKKTAQDDFLIVQKIYEDAKEVVLYFKYLDKPTFISSRDDYVLKYGIYTKDNYLAPAVYSFFANGGKRCYVISTKSNSTSDIVGTVDANNNSTGLQAFEEVDEINILCIPGIEDDTVHQAMITHCETMGDRFCIFDSKKGESLDAIQTRKDGLVSDKGIGALYYPWIKIAVEQKNTEGKVVFENMLIPPSGAMAGIYARSDTERGVHKAPANEVVRGALELERTITKADQDILNPKNINCIRAFPGRGIRIWGARTIAPRGSEWIYINVRRLFLFIEESIDKSTQWAVFEPNNEGLWVKIVQSISSFLFGIWKSGALVGASPKEAFFVKCDRSTMTQDDIDNGRLIVIIGLAPIKPAEFVILRIAQSTADSNS